MPLLALSKGAAFYRATAAGLVQRFPEVVEPIGQGKLCLTTVFEVAKVLTRENVRDVLPRFFELSRREAQDLSAELQRRESPAIRDVVTIARRATTAPALPLAARVEPDLGQETARATASVEDGCEPVCAAAPSTPPVSRRAPPAVEPLTAELTRIHVTLPRRVLEKVEAARAALSHSNPARGSRRSSRPGSTCCSTGTPGEGGS